MLSLTISSWNVRGACKEVNRINISSVVREAKPTIFCLQETKTTQWTDRKINTLGMGSSVGMLDVPPLGLSGGLLTLWKEDEVSLISSKKSRHWIWMMGECRRTMVNFCCANVYAPQKYREKAQLWEDLSSLMEGSRNVPIILIGDFNSVLHESERENCEYSSLDSEQFSNFLSQNQLWDTPLSNSSFTWYGPANKKSKLDRVLVNNMWIDSGN